MQRKKCCSYFKIKDREWVGRIFYEKEFLIDAEKFISKESATSEDSGISSHHLNLQRVR
jgi:hypothetical protein